MAEVLAELRASPGRRVFGVGTMFGLGALVLYLALSESYENILWKVLLIGLSAAAFWSAMRMLQATALWLELHEDGLYDSEGRLIAAYDNIKSVERGMLAMKPSNGFMIVTKTAQKRRWRPGIYWILGRRIGVGGVTEASQSKFIADMMNKTLVDQRGAL